MAKNGINWNILIIAGAVVGGLYFWNKIKTGNTSQDYTSGATGSTITSATPSTIKTDIRQTEATERTNLKQSTLQTGITTAGSVVNNVIDSVQDLISGTRSTSKGSQTKATTLKEPPSYANGGLSFSGSSKAAVQNTIATNQAVYSKVNINPYSSIGKSIRS